MGAKKEDRLDGLTHFVRANERGLARLAWRCLAVRGRRPAVPDIEDVIADAYLLAATKLRNDPELRINDIGAWFRKILFFRCLRHASKWRFDGWESLVNRIEEEDDFLDLLLAQRQRHPLSAEDTTLVREVLDDLEDKPRTVLRLASEGYTSQEIAKELDETPENIRQIKSRALERIRGHVNKGKS